MSSVLELYLSFLHSGNSCLVYSIIRKRQVFYQLANLPSTDEDIREILSAHSSLRRRFEVPPDTEEDEPEEEEDLELDQDEEKATEDTFQDKEIVASAGEEPTEKKQEESVELKNGDAAVSFG